MCVLLLIALSGADAALVEQSYTIDPNFIDSNYYNASGDETSRLQTLRLDLPDTTLGPGDTYRVTVDFPEDTFLRLQSSPADGWHYFNLAMVIASINSRSGIGGSTAVGASHRIFVTDPAANEVDSFTRDSPSLLAGFDGFGINYFANSLHRDFFPDYELLYDSIQGVAFETVMPTHIQSSSLTAFEPTTFTESFIELEFVAIRARDVPVSPAVAVITVPEPVGFALLGVASLAAVVLRRRR